jgi:uncharacterized protein DUF6429
MVISIPTPPASTKLIEKQCGRKCAHRCFCRFNHPTINCSRNCGVVRCLMNIDQEKVRQAVLALLYLTFFDDKSGLRMGKGYDWEVMNSLYENGYISNPATKAKPVILTEEGAKLSKELFDKLFAAK